MSNGRSRIQPAFCHDRVVLGHPGLDVPTHSGSRPTMECARGRSASIRTIIRDLSNMRGFLTIRASIARAKCDVGFYMSTRGCARGWRGERRWTVAAAFRGRIRLRWRRVRSCCRRLPIRRRASVVTGRGGIRETLASKAAHSR